MLQETQRCCNVIASVTVQDASDDDFHNDLVTILLVTGDNDVTKVGHVCT